MFLTLLVNAQTMEVLFKLFKMAVTYSMLLRQLDLLPAVLGQLTAN